MKANVVMFGDAEKKVDNEVAVAKEFILQNIINWMRWAGIDTVELTRPRSNYVISNLTWKGQDIVPKLILELRPVILLNIIKILMDQINVSKLELTLSKDEIADKNEYWDKFKLAKPTGDKNE